jgi:hypothetical protein
MHHSSARAFRTPKKYALLFTLLCLFSKMGLGETVLMERLITFKVDGTIERINFLSADIFVRFSGPMFATMVDPVTGVVSKELGPKLGEFRGALVKFNVHPLRRAFNNGDFATFSCDGCEITFNDGARLNPLLPGFAGDFNIPMEGRAFFGLGTVPTDEPGVMVVRGAGCGGTQEVDGRGSIAYGKGAICMNGGFTLTKVTSIQDIFKLRPKDIVFRGESDCTITLHVPVN